jgi:predicted RNA-binding protein YlxR (DUF448 family)
VALAPAPSPPRRAVLDPAATMPGRGAYLCRAAGDPGAAARPHPDCLERATRRGGLARALRGPVALVTNFVESTSV